MAFCKNCGIELTEGVDFCMQCGTATKETTVDPAPVVVAPVAQEPAKENKPSLNVGMFVWSLINLFLCSATAGVIALVFTLLAKFEEKPKADGYIKIAKVCNIVGIIVGAVATLLAIIYVVFVWFVFLMGMSSEMMDMGGMINAMI